MPNSQWRVKISLYAVVLCTLCLVAIVGGLISGHFHSFFDAEKNRHAEFDRSAYQGTVEAESFFGADTAGKRFTVADLDDPVPQVEDDYIEFVWVNLTQLPSTGERAVLVSRNRLDNGRRTSFSIAVQGSVDGIRPLVSFGNPAHGGEWVSFAEASLQVDHWYAFVVSQVEAGFISVHLLSEGENDTPVLLGAHRIPDRGEKAHKATITVGAIGAESLRGKIGAFGIMRGNGIGKYMRECFEAIVNPRNGPPPELRSSVILWATPYEDMSLYHREVRALEELPLSKKTVKNSDRKKAKSSSSKITKVAKKIESSRKRSKKKLSKKEKN